MRSCVSRRTRDGPLDPPTTQGSRMAYPHADRSVHFAADLAVLRSEGLACGANDYLEFSLYESAIGHFPHHVDAELAVPGP